MILGSFRIPPIAIASIQFEDGWSYASQDVIGGKPRRVFVGPGAPAATLSLYLHASFIDPKGTRDALMALAEAHEVCVLQDESGDVLGQFVIEAIPWKPTWTLGTGQVLAATLELKLVDPGLDELVEAPEGQAIEDAPGPRTNEAPPEDRSTPASEWTPTQISRGAP